MKGNKNLILISAIAMIAIAILASAILAKPPQCRDGLDNGETNCGDGVCEGGETHTTCSQDCPAPGSCSDTDGGFTIGIQGTVSGSSNNQPFNYTDNCESSTILREFYCAGVTPFNQTWNCNSNATTQCLNGACI